MSFPIQMLRQKNDDLQKQINTLSEEVIQEIIEKTHLNETTDAAVLSRMEALETKLTNLITYLKNWSSVGNVNMNDIEEQVCAE